LTGRRPIRHPVPAAKFTLSRLGSTRCRTYAGQKWDNPTHVEGSAGESWCWEPSWAQRGKEGQCCHLRGGAYIDGAFHASQREPKPAGRSQIVGTSSRAPDAIGLPISLRTALDVRSTHCKMPHWETRPLPSRATPLSEVGSRLGVGIALGQRVACELHSVGRASSSTQRDVVCTLGMQVCSVRSALQLRARSC
jgi:hypothetical protein